MKLIFITNLKSELHGEKAENNANKKKIIIISSNSYFFVFLPLMVFNWSREMN